MAVRVDDRAYGAPGLAIAPMRRRHLRAVLRIEAQVYPRPWTLRLFMSELALRNTRTYTVAQVDGIVVGYSGLMVTGEDAHVTTIAVDPAWHRRGVGARLLIEMARTAVELGARHLTLEVRMSNEPAKRLYTKFGFAPAGVRKNYYVETNEDALVMWANDIDTADYRHRLTRIELGLPGIEAPGGAVGPEGPVGHPGEAGGGRR